MSGEVNDLGALSSPLARGVEDIKIVIVKEPSRSELLEAVLSIVKSRGCVTIHEIKRELFKSNGGLLVGENTVRKIVKELSRRGAVVVKPKKGVCISSTARTCSSGVC